MSYRFQMVAVLTAAAFALLVEARPTKDRVDRLPGWDHELLSETFSGYVSAGEKEGMQMFEHYLFFESEGNPATDPVIMWTNGGPGASSFFGSFAELGPYYLSDASLQTDSYTRTGVPTLFRNIYSWTKLGSLLIRNLPPPVGFSYCSGAGPSGDGKSCGRWNDTSTAKHSFEFLNNWYAAFPEFAQRDLYLAGESYAGIYVPTLAREILRNKGTVPERQLKGFAVGDGCLGGSWGGPYYEIEFFHGHGQFADKTYRNIQAKCSFKELVEGVTDAACKAELDQMDKEKGYSFAYNLYDECYDFDLLTAPAWDAPRPHFGAPRRPRGSRSLSPGRSVTEGYAPHHMDGAPCGGTAVLPKWANNTDVRRALHVAHDAVFFDADGWDMYDSTEPELVPFYREAAEQTKLRILVYNGDTDPGLNSFRAENWTKAIGLAEKESWRPWTTDGKVHMGGFVTRYEHDLDYLTIRGSGHMVPEYKPEAAFAFLKAWLGNEEYPHYQPHTTMATKVVV
jgi:carboxypeptidase C (cathepsin A)